PRGGLLHRLAQRRRPGDLEGDVLAVDGVGGAVNQPHPDVDDRVAADRPLLDGLPDSLLHRGPELLGDGAAEDLVLPFEAAATRQLLDLDGAVTVQAGSARLLLVAMLDTRGAVDGLAVGDARCM